MAGAVAAVLVTGCAAPAPPPPAGPPVVLSTLRDSGVHDLRARYRDATCRQLPPQGRACDDVLERLPGEGEPGSAPTVADAALRFRIAFVPGLFSECFQRYARPFSDVQAALAAEGFAVHYFSVPGRGTSADNARRIAEQVIALGDDPRPLILFAYSKGLPDTLEFVVRYPEAAARVAAIVSFAGAANGSPLADDLSSTYRRLGAAFPLPDCDAGSGDEILDLRRDVRLEWWRTHGDEMKIPVFAVVAAPRPEQVSPATRPSYTRLAQIEPRNDGKLLAQDQVAPHAYLLGYVNADHWAIAVPVAEAFPAWSSWFRDGVPRVALARGAIDVVAATLPAPPSTQASAPLSTGRAGTP